MRLGRDDVVAHVDRRDGLEVEGTREGTRVRDCESRGRHNTLEFEVIVDLDMGVRTITRARTPLHERVNRESLVGVGSAEVRIDVRVDVVNVGQQRLILVG